MKTKNKLDDLLEALFVLMATATFGVAFFIILLWSLK